MKQNTASPTYIILHKTKHNQNDQKHHLMPKSPKLEFFFYLVGLAVGDSGQAPSWGHACCETSPSAREVLSGVAVDGTVGKILFSEWCSLRHPLEVMIVVDESIFEVDMALRLIRCSGMASKAQKETFWLTPFQQLAKATIVAVAAAVALGLVSLCRGWGEWGGSCRPPVPQRRGTAAPHRAERGQLPGGELWRHHPLEAACPFPGGGQAGRCAAFVSRATSPVLDRSESPEGAVSSGLFGSVLRMQPSLGISDTYAQAGQYPPTLLSFSPKPPR